MANKILLLNYKRKIEYYSKFYKLCRAVQLISLSKLQQLKGRIENRQSFLDFVNLFFNLNFLKFKKFKAYLMENLEKKVCLTILISTDRVRCTLLNNNIYKIADLLFNNISKVGDSIKFVSFGYNGFVNYRENNMLLSNHLPLFVIDHVMHEPITYEFVIAVLLRLINFSSRIFNSWKIPFIFSKKKINFFFDKGFILYNRYASSRIFPSIFTFFSEKIISLLYTSRYFFKIRTTFFLFFSNWIDIDLKKKELSYFLNDFYLYSLGLLLLDSLEENEICEFGARSFTMSIAFEASKKIVKNVTLLYNKARQQAITEELIELQTAADVLNGQNN